MAATTVLLGGCAAGATSGPATGPATGPAASATVVPLATELPATISYDDAMRLFDYDRSLPFDYREERVTTDSGATLHYFDYLDMSGKRKLATLVLPAGTGPFGAVVDLPGGLSGREEFEPDAIALSKHGVASLLIDSPELYRMPMNDHQAVEEIVFEMRELRRLVDWLAARPEVDPRRLGLAGISYGAVRGVTFAGVEGGRLKVAVLMSTPPTYSFAAMASFDPVVWAPHISPCAFYLQEGTQDTWFTHADGESLIAAAREPKRLTWYEAGHGLNGQAYNDYIGWLVTALGTD